MTVVRMRPPPTGSLREVLLKAADGALRRRGYSEAFRASVRDRLQRLLEGELQSGFVDFSEWPEYTVLDSETLERIGPFVQRLGDAVSAEAFMSLAVALLLPEVIAHVRTLTAGVQQPREAGDPSDDPPGAA
jgi:hypothetical protein